MTKSESRSCDSWRPALVFFYLLKTAFTNWHFIFWIMTRKRGLIVNAASTKHLATVPTVILKQQNVTLESYRKYNHSRTRFHWPRGDRKNKRLSFQGNIISRKQNLTFLVRESIGDAQEHCVTPRNGCQSKDRRGLSVTNSFNVIPCRLNSFSTTHDGLSLTVNVVLSSLFSSFEFLTSSRLWPVSAFLTVSGLFSSSRTVFISSILWKCKTCMQWCVETQLFEVFLSC